MEQLHTRLISENVSFSRSASRIRSVTNLVCLRNISIYLQGAMDLLFMQWLFIWDLPDIQQPLCRGVDGHQKQQDLYVGWDPFLLLSAVMRYCEPGLKATIVPFPP